MAVGVVAYALPPRITGQGSWSALLLDIRRQLVNAHGANPPTSPGATTNIPKLTNKEAVALVMGWRALAIMNRAEGHRFPLWYNFVAHAYGWPDAKRFDTSVARGDTLYSKEAAELLWASLVEIAGALDADRADVPVEITLDETDWTDPLVQGDARAALAQDDNARAFFPVPLPCNPLDPDDPCDETVDDPITGLLKVLFGVLTQPVVLLAVGGLVYAKYGRSKPRRARRR